MTPRHPAPDPRLDRPTKLSDDGRPAQPGDTRTNGPRPAAGWETTPVVATPDSRLDPDPLWTEEDDFEQRRAALEARLRAELAVRPRWARRPAISRPVLGWLFAVLLVLLALLAAALLVGGGR